VRENISGGDEFSSPSRKKQACIGARYPATMK
jgi:hypothetical protein